MSNYTFETFMKIFIVAFISIAFIFASKALYNSFIDDRNEDSLYKLQKQKVELENKKINREIELLEEIYKNDK